MHIYNWYYSITTSILLCTWDENGYVHEHSSCFFSPGSPCSPVQSPSTYLEPSLLWQDPSTSFPGCSWTNSPISLPWLINPLTQNPDPPGFSRSKYTFIRTTLRTQPTKLAYSIHVTRATWIKCGKNYAYTVVKAGGIFLLPRIFPSYFMKILQQIFRKNVLRNISWHFSKSNSNFSELPHSMIYD